MAAPARMPAGEVTPCHAPLSISVVGPCFDRAEFLGEAIESVLAQTRLPLQVIVGDG